MKDECHGGGALLFSYPRIQAWGDHFHEPGGIHLILPSSSGTIIQETCHNVKCLLKVYILFVIYHLKRTHMEYFDLHISDIYLPLVVWWDSETVPEKFQLGSVM